MTVVIPVSMRLRLNFSISSFVNGFDAHCRDDLVNIWMQSHPTCLPRVKDSPTSPAIDMCAPSIGRVDLPVFAIRRILYQRTLKASGATWFYSGAGRRARHRRAGVRAHAYRRVMWRNLEERAGTAARPTETRIDSQPLLPGAPIGGYFITRANRDHHRADDCCRRMCSRGIAAAAGHTFGSGAVGPRRQAA